MRLEPSNRLALLSQTLKTENFKANPGWDNDRNPINYIDIIIHDIVQCHDIVHSLSLKSLCQNFVCRPVCDHCFTSITSVRTGVVCIEQIVQKYYSVYVA